MGLLSVWDTESYLQSMDRDGHLVVDDLETWGREEDSLEQLCLDLGTTREHSL